MKFCGLNASMPSQTRLLHSPSQLQAGDHRPVSGVRNMAGVFHYNIDLSKYRSGDFLPALNYEIATMHYGLMWLMNSQCFLMPLTPPLEP